MSGIHFCYLINNWILFSSSAGSESLRRRRDTLPSEIDYLGKVNTNDIFHEAASSFADDTASPFDDNQADIAESDLTIEQILALDPETTSGPKSLSGDPEMASGQKPPSDDLLRADNAEFYDLDKLLEFEDEDGHDDDDGSDDHSDPVLNGSHNDAESVLDDSDEGDGVPDDSDEDSKPVPDDSEEGEGLPDSDWSSALDDSE